MPWAPRAGRWPESFDFSMNDLSTDILLREIAVSETGRFVLVALAAALGGALGSFLNVVAFRLPRGMSLSHPGSQCPACHRPIRWHDNVPVVGWMRLGGRCRDCGAAISARYPAV